MLPRSAGLQPPYGLRVDRGVGVSGLVSGCKWRVGVNVVVALRSEC